MEAVNTISFVIVSHTLHSAGVPFALGVPQYPVILRCGLRSLRQVIGMGD